LCYILGASYNIGISPSSLALLNLFLDKFDSLSKVFLGDGSSGTLVDLHKSVESLNGTNFLHEMTDNFVGCMGGSERVVVSGNRDSSMVSSDGSGVMDLLNMSDLSNDPDMSFHHLVEGLDDVRVVGETVSLHNME